MRIKFLKGILKNEENAVMKKTARKPIAIFLTCLLLLSNLKLPAAVAGCLDWCGWCYTCEDCECVYDGCPRCGSCRYCGSDCRCRNYGDCWGGCPTCESCVNCYCQCNSECGCDGKTCSGCCVCSNCSCVPNHSNCDEANCYKCENCNCVYRCNPDTQVCCDGSCKPKCEEVGSETLCGSENDTPCRACVGITGNCFDHRAKSYTNEIIYNCSGGCPGECDDEYPDPPCYEEYFCDDYIHYTFAECTNMSETGPVPLECYDAGAPWGCTRCQQGGYYRTLTVLSRRCQ